MIEFAIKKIWKNKWLTVCLVLGMTFLVAVVSCQPMFQMGSQDKLIHNLFNKYIEDNNEYPIVLSRQETFEFEHQRDVKSIQTDIQEYQKSWMQSIHNVVPVIATQSRICFKDLSGQPRYGEHSENLSLSYMPDIEKHIKIIKGKGLETETDGAYSCIVSSDVMDQYGLVVGEKIGFKNMLDQNEQKMYLVVNGFFEAANETDNFWYREPGDMRGELFISKESLESIEEKYKPEKVFYESCVLLDYQKFNHSNIEEISNALKEIAAKDDRFSYNCKQSLNEYMIQKNTVGILIWVLEIPVLGMALAFLFMVSKQIVELEKSEIAMLKSRGFSKLQVIITYFVQFTLMGTIGLLIGVLMGYALCLLVAGSTNFLSFSLSNNGDYHFTLWMLVYGVYATLIGIVIVLIPVFINSNISIVEQKSVKNIGKKAVWEKFYIDILLLAVSAYFLYTYYQSTEKIRAQAIAGSKIDPGIFMDSTLLILAFGLFSLRLVQYLVRFIAYCGKQKWKPATYASFLQITRNYNKQGIISVFLILTVSLGLFYANTARTINQNYIDRIEYGDGADLVIRENWVLRVFWAYQNGGPIKEFRYEEPDDKKYTKLLGNQCDKMTKVFADNATIVENEYKTKSIPNCCLRGINTKEFGEVAFLKDELNKDIHWYTYLNELAKERSGVIISRNLSEALGVKVGDSFTYKRMYPFNDRKSDVQAVASAKVVAIVDAWPAFEQYYMENGEQKERYLIVANYGQVLNVFDIAPYEIWMKLSNGVTSGEVVQSLQDEGTIIDAYRSLDKGVRDMRRTPIIQITNGMFTLSFMICLILCMIGFMIYWISSIKQRELLFGVYRAMGMSMHEINQMLIVEHIFSTFLSIVSGGVVGTVSTLLFVKLIGIIYLPQKHNLGVYTYFEPMDIVRLTITVLVVLSICLLALRKLIQQMNISQALKLGED